MVRITKVYTRTGDAGQTHLVGGQSVPKTDPRIEAYGTVDELNATLGLVRVALGDAGTGGDGGAHPETFARLDRVAEAVQQRLFDVGSELACLPEDLAEGMPRVEQRHVDALEAEIDGLNEGLEPLRSFVLPGGGRAGASYHLARTVCRRAERRVLALAATGGSAAGEAAVRPEVVRYLNRLSDYLFVAGRAAAKAGGVPETLWAPGAD